MRRRLAALLIAVGCGGSPRAVAPPPPAPPPPIAIDCSAARDANAMARSAIARAYEAEDRLGAIRTARRAWAKVTEPACRDGAWYATASMLLAFAPTPALTSGSLTLRSEAEALAAGLTKPDDIDILVRVAFHAARGRRPALPADACARAKAIAHADEPDDVAYVCGQRAIVDGDASTAIAQLAAVKARQHYVDLELAAARAALLAHDRAAARRFADAARATTDSYADRAHVSVADIALVVSEAEALLAARSDP